jgi:hypothetical protein
MAIRSTTQNPARFESASRSAATFVATPLIRGRSALARRDAPRCELALPDLDADAHVVAFETLVLEDEGCDVDVIEPEEPAAE